MSPEDLARRKLRQLVTKHGNQQRAAEALGLSPQYFGDLLHGRREPSTKVLQKLGLKRIVVEQ